VAFHIEIWGEENTPKDNTKVSSILASYFRQLATS